MLYFILLIAASTFYLASCNTLLNQTFEDEPYYFYGSNVVPLKSYPELSGKASRTVCVFARFYSYNGNECLVSIGAPNNAADFNLCFSDYKLGIMGYDLDVFKTGEILHQISVFDWNQYCVTYDGNHVVLYINGEVDSFETGIEFSTADNDAQDNYIGRSNDNSNQRFFYGEMYDFRLYDYALKPEEISNNFQAVLRKKMSEECFRRCDDSFYHFISDYCSIREEFNDLPPFDKECVEHCNYNNYVQCLTNVGCFDPIKDYCDDWQCSCTNKCYQWEACNQKLYVDLEKDQKIKGLCYASCPRDGNQFCVEIQCGAEIFQCFHDNGFCGKAVEDFINHCEMSFNSNFKECVSLLTEEYILEKCQHNNNCASKFDDLAKCYVTNNCHENNNEFQKSLKRRRKQMFAKNMHMNKLRTQRQQKRQSQQRPRQQRRQRQQRQRYQRRPL